MAKTETRSPEQAPHSLSNCELDQLSQYSENHDLSDESANNGLFHTKDVTPNEIH